MRKKVVSAILTLIMIVAGFAPFQSDAVYAEGDSGSGAAGSKDSADVENTEIAARINELKTTIDDNFTGAYGSGGKFLTSIQSPAANAIVIHNAQELNNIRNNSYGASASYSYVLANDIDLSTFGEWTPIDAISGSFDGQGHVIRGLRITGNVDSSGGGLFGNVQLSEIKNVGIEDANIDISLSLSWYPGVGVLIGYINEADIIVKNCWSTGNINLYSTNQGCIGGLIGVLGNTRNAQITDCYSTCSLSTDDSDSSLSGGILGQCYGSYRDNDSLSIERCFSLGSISNYGLSSGIVGWIQSSAENVFITKSYNQGNIMSNHSSGIANGSNCIISECYNLGDIMGDYVSAGIGSGYSFSDCYNGGQISGAILTSNPESYSSISTSGIASSRGATTFQNCYNTGQITVVGLNLYCGGISANSSAIEPEDTIYFSECYNFGDISVDTSGNDQVYVGGIAGNATGAISLENCLNYGNITVLPDSDIIVTDDQKIPSICVGGLVGSRDNAWYTTPFSELRACGNKGNITVSSPDGLIADRTLNIGGLVGKTAYNNTNDGNAEAELFKVTESYNKGNLSVNALLGNGGNWASQAYAGGIIGMGYYCYVSNSYNIGDVSIDSGSFHSYAGGIIGQSSHLGIQKSYNSGSVSARVKNSSHSSYAGGLISQGDPPCKIRNNVILCDRIISTIDTAYGATVPVNEIVGTISSSGGTKQIANNIAIDDLSNVFSVYVTNFYPVGDYLLQMIYESLGWDFDSVWKMPAGGGYPILQWQSDDETVVTPTSAPTPRRPLHPAIV